MVKCQTRHKTRHAKVYCDYVYLDTDERRRFAQVSHEYLIEQVQHQSFGADATKELNFNHPVKELVFGKINGTFDKTALAADTKLTLKLSGTVSFQKKEKIISHDTRFSIIT